MFGKNREVESLFVTIVNLCLSLNIVIPKSFWRLLAIKLFGTKYC